MLISCCMLTLNEIDHVALSVPAVLEHVDELVVIDGGSTDGTVEMLQSFGARAVSYTHLTLPTIYSV